jgi:hypothetical protein
MSRHRGSHAGGAGVMVILLLIGSVPVLGQTSSDETRLASLRQALEAERWSPSGVEVLARQFQVPAAVVEELGVKKQGWGNVSVELAMARYLARMDPVSFRSVPEALQRVELLRGRGKGWGATAKDLGLRLGPVINDLERVRRELRRAERNTAHGPVRAELPEVNPAADTEPAGRAVSIPRVGPVPRPAPVLRPATQVERVNPHALDRVAHPVAVVRSERTALR